MDSAKILDRFIECANCGNIWPQSNNEPKRCALCGGALFNYKYTALTDEHHRAVTDYDRRYAIPEAREMLRVRAERGARGRKKHFTIPRGML